ncbi:MAG: DegT/DnrJ/EryC1/StrS family aminotransferase [Candidatus Beckwithbacteria bacterium]
MKLRINKLSDKFQLGPPYITKDELEAVNKVLTSGQLSLGKETDKFEKEITEFVGAKYAVACSSGTTALHLSVIASGIKSGDEVITTPLSFVASTNCFLYEGAIPKFVDIDPETLNIDVSKIEAAVTKKTKAIVGVDIFGRAAEWREILRIAKKHDLKVIEDAAEALGAKYRGKKLGSHGHLTVFAFYPNKQMTVGEGGVVTTNNKQIYHLIKGLSNQGRGRDMQWLKHEYLGFNYRMTEIQAAIGRVQLKKLDRFLKNRKQVASWYEQRLNQIEGVQLLKQDDEDHQRSWFVYLIKLDKSINRDKVIKKLKAKGIPSKAYLPAIHLQPYMKKYGYKQGDFPICEAVSNSTLALPFYTGMEESTVDQVCNKLKQSLK